MGVSLESLGIHRLSVEERLKLVEAIWNSIAEERTPLDRNLLSKLNRRWEECLTNLDDSLPWEEVKVNVLEN